MMSGILDVACRTYWNWEHGRRQVSPSAMAKLEKIFGIKKQFRRNADWQSKERAADTGRTLRRFRIEKELSPKQVANLLKVSYDYYRKIERGWIVPHRKFYEKFCLALNIPINVFRKRKSHSRDMTQ